MSTATKVQKVGISQEKYADYQKLIPYCTPQGYKFDVQTLESTFVKKQLNTIKKEKNTRVKVKKEKSTKQQNKPKRDNRILKVKKKTKIQRQKISMYRKVSFKFKK